MTNKDLIAHFDKMHAEAMAKYDAKYDNGVYLAAVDGPGGKTLENILGLQDNAMAMCGSPYFQRVFLNWDTEELAFLALFV